jgi:organic hydroperoxide reductase OsmC/OhrA
MLSLPHRYAVTAVPTADGEVRLATNGVPPLPTAAPAEFDGPGDRWSPETMLVGAVADCFAITFRGVARASQVAWTEMTCEVTGTLDRVGGVTRFTRIDLDVHVVVPDGADELPALRVLDKVKRTCLITNSLNADVCLHAAIEARTIDADGCPI